MTNEDDLIIRAATARFERRGEDQIVLRTAGETREVGNVVGAFPLSNPGRMVLLRDEHGEEIGILDDVNRLDPDSRTVIAERLERSYFMPGIDDVLALDLELGVETWEVMTDKGERTFMVRNPRTNVRHVGRRRLVIRDVDGNRYQIRDWTSLSPRARRLLEAHL